jgi:hypothetical protein
VVTAPVTYDQLAVALVAHIAADDLDAVDVIGAQIASDSDPERGRYGDAMVLDSLARLTEAYAVPSRQTGTLEHAMRQEALRVAGVSAAWGAVCATAAHRQRGDYVSAHWTIMAALDDGVPIQALVVAYAQLAHTVIEHTHGDADMELRRLALDMAGRVSA